MRLAVGERSAAILRSETKRWLKSSKQARRFSRLFIGRIQDTVRFIQTGREQAVRAARAAVRRARGRSATSAPALRCRGVRREGLRWVLRVTIDHPQGGSTTEVCSRVANVMRGTRAVPVEVSSRASAAVIRPKAFPAQVEAASPSRSRGDRGQERFPARCAVATTSRSCFAMPDRRGAVRSRSSS